MLNNQKEIIFLKDLGYLYPTQTSKQKKKFGLYRCYCGETFKAQIQSVKTNHTKSCGCLSIDRLIKFNYESNLTIDRKDNDKGYGPDNCRWVTQEIQSRNTRRIRENNTSGYRGVSFKKAINKFQCRINVDKKQIYLGVYDSAIEAALTYDKYVVDNNLEHTKNF